MNRATRTIAMYPARRLRSIESRPRRGPTVRFSTTSTGSGSAPPRSSTARSRADARVNPPSITPCPPGLALVITGDLNDPVADDPEDPVHRVVRDRGVVLRGLRLEDDVAAAPQVQAEVEVQRRSLELRGRQPSRKHDRLERDPKRRHRDEEDPQQP